MTTAAPQAPFLADLTQRSGERPGDGLPWLKNMRQEALQRFQRTGLPTTAEELWRHTPLTGLAQTPFKAAARPVPLERQVDGLSSLRECPWRLVFVDGFFNAQLSTAAPVPPGGFIGSLETALKTESERLRRYWAEASEGSSSLSRLNAALFSDGAYIRLPRGTALEGPIHLLFLSSTGGSPLMSHLRVLIEAEPGSQAQIIEEYVSIGEGVHWGNIAAEIWTGEGAQITWTKLQRESREAFHTAALDVHQERDSRFIGHSFTWGAALSRNDVRVSLEAEGADCELNGLYIVGGRQLADNHTWIDHVRPHGSSRELYKGVLDGSSRGVFSGTVEIRPDAQKSVASVYNKNLLLSDGGLVHTKPEFRISANDVIAKHGATIGRLSEEAAFYLLSRGLSREQARRVLVYAFAREMIDRTSQGELRGILEDSLTALLSSPSGALE